MNRDLNYNVIAKRSEAKETLKVKLLLLFFKYCSKIGTAQF